MRKDKITIHISNSIQSERRLCYRSKNIEGASTNSTDTTNNNSATRALEVIDTSLEHNVLQGTDSSLETGARESRRSVLDQTVTAEGLEATRLRHHITNQVQVTVVDGDTVTLENGVHFADDGGTSSLNTVQVKHVVDRVGVHRVGLDDVLVVTHGEKVDTLSEDVGGITAVHIGFNEDTVAHTRNGLNDGKVKNLLDKGK